MQYAKRPTVGTTTELFRSNIIAFLQVEVQTQVDVESESADFKKYS